MLKGNPKLFFLRIYIIPLGYYKRNRRSLRQFCFLALIWTCTNQMQDTMALESKKDRGYDEKKWENPAAPERTGDERDREQLLRQYKEAQRRKDNLTDDNETKEETK